ncbi:hypothetical protein DOX43_09815 [Cronobacter malonaticus]|nr:hypothetical protein [Cronobacter malonaticus]EGT4483977.1 hypothetical protein [Cronobacter malonaticus]
MADYFSDECFQSAVERENAAPGQPVSVMVSLSDYSTSQLLHFVILIPHISLVFLLAVMIITFTPVYVSLHQLT